MSKKFLFSSLNLSVTETDSTNAPQITRKLPVSLFDGMDKACDQTYDIHRSLRGIAYEEFTDDLYAGGDIDLINIFIARSSFFHPVDLNGFAGDEDAHVIKDEGGIDLLL